MKDYYKSLHKNRGKHKWMTEKIDMNRLTRHLYHVMKANERKNNSNTKTE